MQSGKVIRGVIRGGPPSPVILNQGATFAESLGNELRLCNQTVEIHVGNGLSTGNNDVAGTERTPSLTEWHVHMQRQRGIRSIGSLRKPHRVVLRPKPLMKLNCCWI